MKNKEILENKDNALSLDELQKANGGNTANLSEYQDVEIYLDNNWRDATLMHIYGDTASVIYEMKNGFMMTTISTRDIRPKSF